MRIQKKTKKNTICVGHHYAQANTNNINKTWALVQTTGGKDEPFLCGKFEFVQIYRPKAPKWSTRGTGSCEPPFFCPGDNYFLTFVGVNKVLALSPEKKSRQNVAIQVIFYISIMFCKMFNNYV